ncbi:N-carbamoyl-L-amino-acid hydrolase [compost metagenome]
MGHRRDALVAASRLVLEIERLAMEFSRGDGHFTATVGEFAIEPNAANVVPSRVRLLIDARAELRPQMERFLDALGPLCQSVAEASGVTIAPANVISDNHPTPGDALLLSTLEESCDAIGAKHRRIASGAGHDTAWMGRITRSAMIFIPCLGGRSHAPEEWAENDDIALGTAVLFDAVKRLDRRLQEKV